VVLVVLLVLLLLVVVVVPVLVLLLVLMVVRLARRLLALNDNHCTAGTGTGLEPLLPLVLVLSVLFAALVYPSPLLLLLLEQHGAVERAWTPPPLLTAALNHLNTT